MHRLKILILYLAKYLGGFYIAKKLTAKGIRIICYHGFAFDDEYIFRPKLFMRKATLDKRLNKISEMGFLVITLDKAVGSLMSGKPPLNAVVITVDDGWRGLKDMAWPLFEEYGFPWTFYLSTYYADKQTQVTNLALQYLCWKTHKTEIDLSQYGQGFARKILLSQKSNDALAARLTAYGETLETAQDRQDFVRNIAVLLDVNQGRIERKKMFYFIDMETVKVMHQAGVDIQLHTHRHTLGHILGDEGKEITGREINDNRKMIEKVCSHTPVHFCYPSGFYSEKHLQWLADENIISATTCKTGLNYTTTPLLELNRFLDGENVSPIEFEAELSGFAELLRKVK